MTTRTPKKSVVKAPLKPENSLYNFQDHSKFAVRLDIPTFSINSMFNCGNARLGKSAGAQDWTLNAFYELSKYEALFIGMRSVFDPLLHYYSVKLHAHYPIKQFQAKGSGISQRTHDLSNFEKPLIDLIFLAKHCEYAVPYGCQNLCIDDKYVAELLSTKRATTEDKPFILVDIEIKFLSELVGNN